MAVSDVDALADMTGLATELDELISRAVAGLRGPGTRGLRSRPGLALPARPLSNDGDMQYAQQGLEDHRGTRAPGH